MKHNLFSSTMSSGSGESSSDPFDLSSDNDEYSIPKTVMKTMVGERDRAAWLLTVPNLYINSTPE